MAEEPKQPKMVIVDGVRYREEDAPDASESGSKQAAPKNKARTADEK